MTFEQDLNTWCADTESRLRSVEQKIIAVAATQKLLIALSLADLALIGGLIAAIVGVLNHG